MLPIAFNALHVFLTFYAYFVAAVAEWYRYRTVASFVTGSSSVPLKTRRVGQRCTLNLSRAETSSLGVRFEQPMRAISSPAKIQSESEHSDLTHATTNHQGHGTFQNNWLDQSEAFYSPAWKFHCRSTSTFQIWNGGSLREPYARLWRHMHLFLLGPFHFVVMKLIFG
ncbi:hypothetical protein TNCV_3617061 [Trichonephila clavipes]|nr:hypothetical protein TNCV_3617061 [Trichonephila clavipes]